MLYIELVMELRWQEKARASPGPFCITLVAKVMSVADR